MKIRRTQNKENKMLIEEFCFYNDSECKITAIVFENELWEYLDVCNHAMLYFRSYKHVSKYPTQLF